VFKLKTKEIAEYIRQYACLSGAHQSYLTSRGERTMDLIEDLSQENFNRQIFLRSLGNVVESFPVTLLREFREDLIDYCKTVNKHTPGQGEELKQKLEEKLKGNKQ